jgi:hypothetical protein
VNFILTTENTHTYKTVFIFPRSNDRTGHHIVFSNCESALSNVEIKDPSLLQTHFVVERSVLNDGSVVQALSATPLDKNFASIE